MKSLPKRPMNWLRGWLLPVCLLMLATHQPVTAGDPPKPVATVLVFLDTECPISQQYTRPLAALYGQYAAKGVYFQAVFPSVTDTQAAIRAFSSAYKLPFTGQPDPDRTRVRQYRAEVTPEVVLLDKQGIVRYQGAIDDWFITLGRYRREPTQYYLRDALAAVLDGRPVPVPRAEPVGCRIQ